MEIPSSILQKTLEAFSSLPGIGKKSALRLTLHLLQEQEHIVEEFCQSVRDLKLKTKSCSTCHNIADGDLCNICSNPQRNKRAVCVVENLKDLIAIENTQQFNGIYHLLGGLLSPLQGISADHLYINDLVERIKSQEEVEEVVFALSPNIQGDTTVYYIQKQLGTDCNVKLSTIARGIAFGGELEYADELTLGRSLTNRLPIENYIEE